MSGGSPLVSVLVPAYNAEAYVGAAIESVLGQTYRHVEVVVVNDGSTDGTRDVLRRYERAGVRVIDQPNAGQCAAANRAYAASRGALVKFFDADDVLGADHLERQVHVLDGRPGHVAMAEWARFYEAPEDAVFRPLPAYRDASAAEWLTSEWMHARPMMQCALWLVPRTVLERSGLWDVRLSLINDFEFFTRVMLHGAGVVHAPGARLHYRSGVSGSLSGLRSRGAVESALLSLTLGTGHLLAVDDGPRARAACANLFQDFAYTYYPEHPDLRDRALRRVRELGGSALAPDGPPGFRALRRLIGWRLARRAERLASRYALNRASLSKRFGLGA